MKSWKRWLVRGVLLVTSPMLFFGATEGFLRLIDHGQPTRYFLKEEGRETVRTNPRFTWRFFPPALSRAPDNRRLTLQPDETVRRLIILGESAAQGAPTTEYGFSRILENLLTEAWPTERWEVVNLASTAINSHVIRLIAGEAVTMEPGALLIYMGNNEVVGPYGPGSAWSRFQPSLPVIRASLWVKGTRLGQLLQTAMARLAPPSDLPRYWEGMAMFTPYEVAGNDPRLAGVRRHFRENLEAILDRAAARSIPVILSTVAVNLRDCPPFASKWPDRLSEAEKSEALRLDEQARAAAGRAEWTEAGRLWKRAIELAPGYAAFSFGEGRAALALGQTAEARLHFARARDEDVLRFRSDSVLNETIRLTAGKHQGRGVVFLDSAAELGADGAPGEAPIAGAEFFFEHVHLTFEGNYRLAMAFAERLPEALPGLPAPRPWPNLEQCQAALGFGRLGRTIQLQGAYEMIEKPPFTNQEGHARQVGEMRREMTALDEVLSTPNGIVEETALLRRAADQRPNDPWLRLRLALFLLEKASPDEAAVEFDRAVTLLPETDELAFLAAKVAGARRDWTRAEEKYRRAMALNPYNYQAQVNLANLIANRGRLEEGIGLFRRIIAAVPGHPELHYGLARLLLAAKRTAEAEFQLRESLRLLPRQEAPLQLLIRLLEENGRGAERWRMEEQLADADPAWPDPPLALSRHFHESKDPDRALAWMKRAVAADPGHAQYRYWLSGLLGGLNRWEEAAAELETLLRDRPDYAPAANDLAWLLATAPGRIVPDPPRALALAQLALGGSTEPPAQYLGTLAAARVANGDFPGAVEALEKALQRAQTAGPRNLVERYEKALEACRENRLPNW